MRKADPSCQTPSGYRLAVDTAYCLCGISEWHHRKALLRRDTSYYRVDQLLQFFNAPAVDAQLGQCPAGIYGALISIQKISDAVFNNAAAVGNICNLHNGPLEEVSHAVDERIVIDDVGNLRRGYGEAISHLDFLRLFQIGCAGKADHGINGLIRRPLTNYGTELNSSLTACGILIDENGQAREFADQVAQLIGLPILFIITLVIKTDLAFNFLYAVQNNLFRIGDSH